MTLERMERTFRVSVAALAFRKLDGATAIAAGALIIVAWTLVALFAPILAPHDPMATDLSAVLKPPLTPGHWLGTDRLGRDVLSRIIFATRVDLSMGLIGVTAPFLIGTIIGLNAGYLGGVVDTFLMRLLDVALAFPFFVLVLAIVGILGPGLINYYIALAIVAWVPYTRLVRAEVLVLRRKEFVEAAQVLGFSRTHIMIRHVLPNAISPAVVFLMTDIVLTILLGSALSFFGMGAQPPTPEWGRMIAEGKAFLATAWWMSVFPGITLILMALGFSLLGDGLAKQLRVRV
ncbi:MAG: ABC transporter permease [Nitrospiraceae bacterium]